MSWKCIIILTVLTMELFILILEVETKSLARTSFPHSALPIEYVHSSKLDGVEESLDTCFTDWVNYCRQSWPNDKHFYHDCIVLGATSCLLQTVKEGQKGSPLSEYASLNAKSL